MRPSHDQIRAIERWSFDLMLCYVKNYRLLQGLDENMRWFFEAEDNRLTRFMQ